MGGGLLQLVAYGAQDVYLSGNPQITFFKVVYRRHTNFSMEAIVQTFNGSVGPNKRVTSQISRNGDLVHKMYVVFKDVNGAATGHKALGQHLIKKVEVEIGGQLIDRQYSEWMYIWNELSLPSGKQTGFESMVNSGSKLYVPLEFWFCRNIGLALPLIALQYHEVKLNIDFSGGATSFDAELWADYIFLDTDERRRFAQLSHEYLIEQVQHTGSESYNSGSTKQVKLSFNHPVKELVWVLREDDTKNDVVNWTSFTDMSMAKLQLNGTDRFAERDGTYFTHVQPYQHHTNIPDSKVNVYSFGLKPEEHQPSGTLNFSRIDQSALHITPAAAPATGKNGQILIYAVNYNVLRILSGMGGLAYSN